MQPVGIHIDHARHKTDLTRLVLNKDPVLLTVMRGILVYERDDRDGGD